MTMAPAIAAPRGCGASRTKGGIYWECGLDPDGAPIEEFLIDPPTPIPAGLAITPRGVSLIQIGGVAHVVDWVGAEHYPNVLDFVLEVGRLGLSRRLPVTLDFAQLVPASRILLVHARARVENAHAYGPFPCPRELHGPGTNACIGAWWEDVTGGTAVPGPDPRAVTRALPSLSYRARRVPEEVMPEHAPGFFASFPASRLAVVAGGDGRARVAALRASIPVADVSD